MYRLGIALFFVLCSFIGAGFGPLLMLRNKETRNGSTALFSLIFLVAGGMGLTNWVLVTRDACHKPLTNTAREVALATFHALFDASVLITVVIALGILAGFILFARRPPLGVFKSSPAWLKIVIAAVAGATAYFSAVMCENATNGPLFLAGVAALLIIGIIYSILPYHPNSES